MSDETMFDEAVRAVQKGEVTRARDLLTRLIKLDPRNVDCWLWMSAVVETPKERIYCLQEVQKIDPTNQVARRGLIMAGVIPADDKLESVGFIRRNWQSALNDELNKKEPTSWRKVFAFSGMGLLALALIILGIIGTRSIIPAVSRLRPANTLKPSSTYLPTSTHVVHVSSPTFVGPTPLWMLLKATYTPTALYVVTPHTRTEDFRLGMFRFNSGDYKNAIPFFQQAQTAEPQAPDILFFIAESNRLLGNTADAAKQYDQTIELDASFAPPYLARALLSLAANPKADIRPDLEKAVALDAAFAEAYLQLAALDLQDGQYQAVLDDAARAAKTRPDSSWVYLYQAQAYLALNQADQALESAQKANQLDTTILQGYLVLGQALQANQNMAASLAPLKTYLVYQPDDPVVLILLGNAYAAQNDPANAILSFTRAIGQDSHSFDAYFGRGKLFLDQGADQKAVNDLYTAYQLNQKSFDACLDLGRAYTQNGSFTNANFQFTLAEKLAVKDADLAAIYYWRAISLSTAGQPLVALADWQKLLALPAGAVPQDWAARALKGIADANTPTVTTTATRTLTATTTGTRTLTATPSPSPTRTRTYTTTYTRTPTPSRTATLTPTH